MIIRILAFMNFLMKNTLAVITIIFLNLSNSKAQSLEVQFDFCQFTSEQTSFLETYLSIDGKSSRYVKNNNGQYQSTLEILYEFKDSSGAIKKTDRYNLLSPMVDDTTNINFVFLDQQRYTLENGKYLLTLEIKDSNGKAIKHQQDIEIKEQNGLYLLCLTFTTKIIIN